MFVDASAIVAILTREPEADSLADLLEAAPSPITSPIAVFEAALGICRKRHASVEEAEDDVREFLEKAASMANHASTRTTQLYDRRSDEVTLDEVERVGI